MHIKIPLLKERSTGNCKDKWRTVCNQGKLKIAKKKGRFMQTKITRLLQACDAIPSKNTEEVQSISQKHQISTLNTCPKTLSTRTLTPQGNAMKELEKCNPQVARALSTAGKRLHPFFKDTTRSCPIGGSALPVADNMKHEQTEDVVKQLFPQKHSLLTLLESDDLEPSNKNTHVMPPLKSTDAHGLQSIVCTSSDRA